MNTGRRLNAGATLGALQSQLTQLRLKGCYRVAEQGLQQLHALRTLCSLDLQDCWQITHRALAWLSCTLLTTCLHHCMLTISTTALHRLTELSLQGCRNVANQPGQPIPGLATLTALQQLSLRNCDRLQDGALLALTRMARLGVLDVSGCQQLSGRGLVPLGVLPALHTLKLQHWTDATGDGVKVCLLVMGGTER